MLAKSDHGLIRDWCLCPGVASFSPCSYSHGAHVTQGTPHKQNRNSYSMSWWLLEPRRRRMARSLGTETGTPCYSPAGHHCSGLGYLPINGHCLEPPCQIVLGTMVTGSVCTQCLYSLLPVLPQNNIPSRCQKVISIHEVPFVTPPQPPCQRVTSQSVLSWILIFPLASPTWPLLGGSPSLLVVCL